MLAGELYDLGYPQLFLAERERPIAPVEEPRLNDRCRVGPAATQSITDHACRHRSIRGIVNMLRLRPARCASSTCAGRRSPPCTTCSSEPEGRARPGLRERARDVRPPRRDPPHAEVRRRLPLRRAASFGRRGRRHLALREELHLLLRRLSRGDGHKRAACQQPAARAGCGARGVRDRAGGQRLPAARETRCAHPSSRRRRERRTPTSTR